MFEGKMLDDLKNMQFWTTNEKPGSNSLFIIEMFCTQHKVKMFPEKLFKKVSHWSLFFSIS